MFFSLFPILTKQETGKKGEGQKTNWKIWINLTTYQKTNFHSCSVVTHNLLHELWNHILEDLVEEYDIPEDGAPGAIHVQEGDGEARDDVVVDDGEVSGSALDVR
jgi:hypothetical protein